MNQDIPLGKATQYPQQYDASLLFPVARQIKRDEIGVSSASLPFTGDDLWTAYELSWLNEKGKPQVFIGEFFFSCDSENIIESKSFKLYLNSLNQTRFASAQQAVEVLRSDLSSAAKGDVDVILYSVDDYQQKGFGELVGHCIDHEDVECSQYDYQADLLKCKSNSSEISEVVYSHLLKSNCLITSQPDWATVIISYQGKAIDHGALLQYLVSFRNHNEFHEQCVERIFNDLMHYCRPQKLTVTARYTRRGGLDINPSRSNCGEKYGHLRLARQ